MAYSEILANRLREALADLPKVEEKKMFGGIAFLINGNMTVTTKDARIMVRIDPAIHDDIVEKKDCRTMIMNGKEYKGYVTVSEEHLKKKSEFNYWLKLALDYNKTLPPKKNTKGKAKAKQK